MSQDRLETLINLLMLLALVVAIVLWWATKHGGTRGRIAERTRQAAVVQRNESALAEEDDDEGTVARLTQRLARLGDRLPLFDAKYRAKLRTQMVRSGYRSQSAVSVLLAIKFVVGLICAAFAVMLGSHIPVVGGYPAVRGIMMLLVFVVGMILPEYVIAFFAARRRKAMASCLPDALDLLVICTNAGNSLGVSIRRVADELKSICPPLSGEFSLTADELKLSGDSTRALQALADRIDLPSIRALISTLTQSMRYGTPITQALRTLSHTERLAHIVSLEEKAAKLAPKMAVPMMIFILPAVMLIAAGPAVIQLMSVFAKQ
ncbi:type II secretion system protein [Caballeronia turbans]|jgi:tight adherence protein C|uniref:type II secretion system F family protein n=1 Tax=unclassified Caballeronia TaxID=2646786 RepID=UPI00074C6752|nr:MULTISPECIES: type II secretion system F family protein [unclassified Caballeronia]SAL30498.1 type II secretion system protein [Caballeronia turbans]